jgi:hypothetical protein
MRIREAITTIATTVGTILVIPFLQAPAAKLSESVGFDKLLSEEWGPAMSWLPAVLSYLSHNPWYIFASGAAVGSAITLWADIKLKREASREPEKLGFVRTSLTLHFSGGYDPPTSLFEENVLDWYVYWIAAVEIRDQNGNIFAQRPSSWVLFVNFKKSTEYHSVSIDFIGGKPNSYQIRRTLITSLVVSIDGPLPACSLELRTRSNPSPFG